MTEPLDPRVPFGIATLEEPRARLASTYASYLIRVLRLAGSERDSITKRGWVDPLSSHVHTNVDSPCSSLLLHCCYHHYYPSSCRSCNLRNTRIIPTDVETRSYEVIVTLLTTNGKGITESGTGSACTNFRPCCCHNAQ